VKTILKILSGIALLTLLTGSALFADKMNSMPVYLRYYPYIKYIYNTIQWMHFPEVQTLFDDLGETVTKRFTVVHIGDSHVQADIFTGHIREQLQNTFGAGGRGFIFPYDAALTHATMDYRTQANGKWQYAKNIQTTPGFDLGISGVTIYTADSTAGFRFIFKPGILREHFKKITIFCRTSVNSFDLQIKSSGMKEPVHIKCNSFNLYDVVETLLPAIGDTLDFAVIKTQPQQKYFECYGIMIESTYNNGIVYHSVGINGAGYKSILRQNLMVQQLKKLKPNLVIIDLGANDFFQTDIDTIDVKNNLLEIIKRIRAATPEAFIMISNTQDVKCKTPNSSELFAKLTRETAFENKCLFYDYFNISGGTDAMLQWAKDSLVKKDMIHLTKTGYQLKGELYLNGILNAYQSWLANRSIESLLVETSKHNVAVNNSNKEEQEQSAIKPLEKSKTVYKIKEKDTLVEIANRFKVTVNDILYWNNLSDETQLHPGKKLIIYTYNTK